MAWTTCDAGHVHWGPRGAAGLLVAEEGRALLQLRARWTHQGGTWSVPGGAVEPGEPPVRAALREAAEELGVDPALVDVRAEHVAACGGWSYHTVLAVPRARLVLTDLAESDRHVWVPADHVADLPLHPAFRRAWTGPASPLRAFVDGTAPA